MRNQIYSKQISFLRKENVGWRFLSKTRRAWTWLIKNWNLPLLSFYLFFFIFLEIGRFLIKWDLKKVDPKDVSSSERVWNFKAEKRNKCKSYYFSDLKFHTLSLVWFCGYWKSLIWFSILIQYSLWFSILTKTMQISLFEDRVLV